MNALKFYSLKINKVKPITDSSVCLTFEIPSELKETFDFTQGQFLTLRSDIDGEDTRRSYSICSGVDDDCLQVGIKRVKNGKFSNYANDELSVNSIIDVMPPQGSFYTELSADNAKEYICIAAGSGITPILSIMKSILSREPQSTVTLIYGNRSTTSMMFKDEIGFVKNSYMNRFTWINIMSAEDQGTDVLNGKINNEKGAALHKAKLIDITKVDDVFICGPEAMMSEVSRGFRSSGLSEDNIHYELFANSAEDSEKILEKYQERIEEYGEDKKSEVTLRADGRAIKFDLASVGENILDAGIHNGLDLPYACKAGVCSTCKAKLIKGKVDMDLSHGLEQHEIDDGYILTCQAHPISDKVEVDFDQRK